MRGWLVGVFASVSLAVMASTAFSENVMFGAAVGSASSPSDLSRFEALTGKQLTFAMKYLSWADRFPGGWLANIGTRTPVLTWEPWNPAIGALDNTYPLERIAAGDFDTYIRTWAYAAAKYQKPIYIRFAHEMNGDWTPWSLRPAAYISAWRHIHNIFVARGATNVRWVWSPNNEPSSTIKSYYPGENYVDVVGIDGYNWGTSQSWSRWQTFTDVFRSSYAAITAFTSKPIMIAETASSEKGGQKSNWIADLPAQLASFPQIQSLIWFNVSQDADWIVNSSPSSLQAIRGVKF